MNKGKIITDRYYGVEVGASVIIRNTEYGSTIINTFPNGQYVDEVDTTRLAKFVELDKDESELPKKKTITLDEFGAMLGIPVVHMDAEPLELDVDSLDEVQTPFGYSVKTGGLNSTGAKLNKK